VRHRARVGRARGPTDGRRTRAGGRGDRAKRAGDFAFCPFISHFVRSFRVLSVVVLAEKGVIYSKHGVVRCQVAIASDTGRQLSRNVPLTKDDLMLNRLVQLFSIAALVTLTATSPGMAGQNCDQCEFPECVPEFTCSLLDETFCINQEEGCESCNLQPKCTEEVCELTTEDEGVVVECNFDDGGGGGSQN